MAVGCMTLCSVECAVAVRPAGAGRALPSLPQVQGVRLFGEWANFVSYARKLSSCAKLEGLLGVVSVLQNIVDAGATNDASEIVGMLNEYEADWLHNLNTSPGGMASARGSGKIPRPLKEPRPLGTASSKR